MSQPFVPPAQPNANVGSTRWTGSGLPQQAPGWCFAAAEQMIQRAFGVTVSQVEIAHQVLLARGRAEDPQGNARAYYARLREIANGFGLPNLDWATVQPYVESDERLYRWLTSEWGQPPLSGRRYVAAGMPNAASIVETIDVGGLVIVGTAVHWKVVHGYRSDATGQIVSYRVYDPYDGGRDYPAMSPEETLRGAQQTYYVTG